MALQKKVINGLVIRILENVQNLAIAK